MIKQNQKRRNKVKKTGFKLVSNTISLSFSSVFAAILIVYMAMNIIPVKNNQTAKKKREICDRVFYLTTQPIDTQTQRTLKQAEFHCYIFHGEQNSRLYVKTDKKAIIKSPDQTQTTIFGDNEQNLTQTGEYTIILSAPNHSVEYTLFLSFVNSDTPTLSDSLESENEPISQTNISTSKLAKDKLLYNVQDGNIFYYDTQLQVIVDEAVQLVERRGLSSQTLSISLINLGSSPCCAYGSYQDKIPRFPASVVKLFWIVAYYAQVQAGILQENRVLPDNLYKMINKSDNEFASDVVDAITDTQSLGILQEVEFKDWLYKRHWINRFFESSGYESINLSQKNFPIPKLNLMNPQGVEKQIRIGSGEKEIRNQMRTYDVARLLYEIETGQAVSSEYSKTIKSLMRRNLDPNYWSNIEYNCVQGFFPELLPTNAEVFSKVGWYSGSRQDVAIIYSPDRKVKYILAIFGEDKNYADNWEIFPELSRLIYDRMVAIE